MGLFQKGFHLVAEANSGDHSLLLLTGHRTPQALLRGGYEAQHQFLGHMPSDQPLGIAKIILAATARTVRLRLCQMQASRHGGGIGCGPNHGLPVAFQSFPHRLPVLRRGMHGVRKQMHLSRAMRLQLSA